MEKHSWQRGPNPLFYEDHSYIAYPSFFKFYPNPLFLVASNPTPHCSFCCHVSLAEWVIAPHLRCAILLNAIMDVHMSSLRTLVRVLCNKASGFIECIGVSPPRLFHQPPPLKSTNCPSPPF